MLQITRTPHALARTVISLPTPTVGPLGATFAPCRSLRRTPRLPTPCTRTFATSNMSQPQPQSQSQSQPQPQILGTDELKTEAKWLKLERIRWRDQTGKERAWEVANRTTRKGPVDSVHILTLLHHPSRPISTILIEQYRPPAGATCIELPAGLLDEGEDAVSAALRELHEETGYGDGTAKAEGIEVGDVSSVLVKDPGMTGANMQLVTVNVHLKEDDPEPEQHLDDGEHIVKRVVPLAKLDSTLQEYAKAGFAIDALVACVVQGMRLAGKL